MVSVKVFTLSELSARYAVPLVDYTFSLIIDIFKYSF
ncbi:protein of unknown function [Vibrio tapetis subsp. tapetis]|uniref:Uncharacterized protein n=1 Tax=Vibrio tapetis subsp. tapetis TaxID=1671868 RepID=A0A2N8ZCA5_9VIBR|nr:protein of unknown function [Vibrio tapetis subsp. tapetis]